MTTYHAIRTNHFSRCPLAARHPGDANRMHRAILRVAARHGARQFIEPRHRAAVIRACMMEARVPTFLPTLFAPILMELLKLLLPIVTQWILEMLGKIDPNDLFTSSAAVDRDLARWVAEADR